MAKTLAQLEAALDNDLAWRRAELVAMETELQRHELASPGAPLTRALSRSSVALLYAHWEGYVKDAAEAYLEFVAVRRLRYDELADGLLLTSLSQLLRRLDSGDEVARDALLDVVRRPNQARARIPRRGTVSTKSNLRFDVLQEIFNRLALPSSRLSTRRNLIDRSLCDARNEIAHGRLYFPDPQSFADLKDNVLDTIDVVRGAIIEHARRQLYKCDLPSAGE